LHSVLNGDTLDEETDDAMGFWNDASVRLGVPQDRLRTMVRAARLLSAVEMEVVEELVHLADAGVSEERRMALSRGVVRALEAFPGESVSSDPLAPVDEPFDTVDLAESLARTEVEGQEVREEILRDAVSAAEAARRTGRSRQAIERLRRAGRLLGLRVGARWRYPGWQFSADSPGGVVPRLDEVLRHLELSPTGAAFWLLRPAERLGGRPPIELLRRFRPQPVVDLAREQSVLP
jgi:hypothetical protein